MLRDGLGRSITYLRISLLKGCNLSCNYCMPERIPFKMNGTLTPQEIEKLVQRFVARGVSKLRLTGGEPTLRPDLVEIATRLSRLAGVRDIALSTNAIKLRDLAKPLYQAGVRRLNVSLDSLQPEVFRSITRSAVLDQVIQGIEAAVSAGFEPVKLNTVVLRGVNDHEVEDLVAFAAERQLQIRFIEMMPTGAVHGIQPQHYVSNRETFERLGGEQRWEATGSWQNGGPARHYRDRSNPQAPLIGFINPLSQNFCADCNRVRLTAEGKLRTCLFGNHEVPLRPHLEGPDWTQRLDQAIDAALGTKPASHELETGNYGDMVSFVQIGG